MLYAISILILLLGIFLNGTLKFYFQLDCC